MKYEMDVSAHHESASLRVSKNELATLALVEHTDILEFGGRVKELVFLNKKRDVQGLINMLVSVCDRGSKLTILTQVEALSAMRDIGMILSSLRRHDIEPIALFPTVEPLLLHLGTIAHSVPRDTVYTYALWNPKGDAQRRFTDTPEEGIFIDSIRTWLREVESCRELLNSLVTEPWCETVTPSTAISITNHFQVMVDQMVAVRRGIPTNTFYEVLQPYFYPIMVGESTYEAPSGAHMNLLLVDHMLWGRNTEDEAYKRYQEHNALYVPEMYRTILAERNELSLQEFLRKAVAQGDIDLSSSWVQLTLRSLYEMVNKIVSMRRIHFTIAREQDAIKVSEGKEAAISGDDILSILLRHSASFRDELKIYARTI